MAKFGLTTKLFRYNYYAALCGAEQPFDCLVI